MSRALEGCAEIQSRSKGENDATARADWRGEGEIVATARKDARSEEQPQIPKRKQKNSLNPGHQSMD